MFVFNRNLKVQKAQIIQKANRTLIMEVINELYNLPQVQLPPNDWSEKDIDKFINELYMTYDIKYN